jgi:hypothetical protein
MPAKPVTMAKRPKREMRVFSDMLLLPMPMWIAFPFRRRLPVSILAALSTE